MRGIFFFPPVVFWANLEQIAGMSLGKWHFNVTALGNSHKLKTSTGLADAKALKSTARNAPGFTV